MRCPECGLSLSNIVHSQKRYPGDRAVDPRTYPGPPGMPVPHISRMRQCRNCQHKYRTYEFVAEDMPDHFERIEIEKMRHCVKALEAGFQRLKNVIEDPAHD